MPFDRFKQTETITYLQMSNTFILIENAQKNTKYEEKKNSIYKIHKYTLLYVTKVGIKFKKTVTKDRK